MTTEVVLQTNIPELKLYARGKVRDIYEVPPYLLIVTTDRISAFDVVLPEGIPHKGEVLTELSTFWFNFVRHITPTHFITSEFTEIIRKFKELAKYEEILKGRTMLVKKSEVFPVECVVRGYLAGSAWQEYEASQSSASSAEPSVCGIPLPLGLTQSARLPEPIFTPATKAASGHDQNITFERMKEIVGPQTAEVLRERSLKIYRDASAYAFARGIILSDTKFEWGKTDKDIILVDEVLTPDSSRFWPRDGYVTGKSQPSFDKQFVRDYLEKIRWNKTPPAPSLPQEIIKKTSEKYLEARRRLIGIPNFAE